MNKHITMSKVDNMSVLHETNAPAFSLQKHTGWQGLSFDDVGVSLFIFNIAEDATEFPIHSAPDTWIAYVASGSGTLFSGTDSGNKDTSTTYQAGDFITFHPHTPHGWLNNNAASKILFVKSNP